MTAKMDQATMDRLMALEEQMRPQMEFAEKLLKENPSLPFMTAQIMANDKVSMDRAWTELEKGVPFDKALILVGSYYKLEFMLKAIEKGFTRRSHILDILPDNWPSADPDDTDTRFLWLWIDASMANGGKLITDRGKKLPKGSILTVYRGQPEDATLGIAWSLDETIAQKFMRGAWARMPVEGGVVYKAKIRRKDVIAYLTGRNEEEIILNPLNLITDED